MTAYEIEIPLARGRGESARSPIRVPIQLGTAARTGIHRPWKLTAGRMWLMRDAFAEASWRAEVGEPTPWAYRLIAAASTEDGRQ